MKRRTRFAVVMAALLVLLYAAAVLGVSVGSTEVGFADAAGTLLGRGVDDTAQRIVFLRLRRVILAGIVGASLAAAGVALQALLRNPLADPFILGVSGGAAVGAAGYLVFGGVTFSASLAAGFGLSKLAASALAGALVASGVVLLGGRRRGHIMPTTLLLVGVMVNAVCGAAVLALTFLASRDRMQEIVLWMMGDVGRPATSRTLWVTGSAVGILAILLWRLGGRLNVMSLGDEDAAHLGVNVGRTRVSAFVFSALVTGLSVALAGPIGFVGLVVPHITRMLVGADHRFLFPASFVFGAGFLVVADTLARVLRPGDALPVGILTAAIGGPFFIWLLRMRRGRYFE